MQTIFRCLVLYTVHSKQKEAQSWSRKITHGHRAKGYASLLIGPYTRTMVQFYMLQLYFC